jgi:hypothetical protein
MEDKDMQSTKGSNRYTSIKVIASTARRREGIRAALKAAMGAWTGSGILALLFAASLAYVALGGRFAASSAFDTESLVEALVVEPGAVGVALQTENVSALSGKVKQ